MAAKKQPKVINYYCADFETTTQAVSQDSTSVWLWYIENVYDKYDNGLEKDIKSFFNFLEEKEEDCTVFFHNLNWDGEFLLNYLADNYIYAKQEVGKYTLKLKRGEWTTMSDGPSSHYLIRFINQHNKEVKFQCSYKQLLASVSTLQGVQEKKKIDYDKVSYNKATFEYIKKDVRTVIPFMQKLIENHKKTMGITSSGTAQKEFKKTLKGLFTMFFDKEIKVGQLVNGVYKEGQWDYFKKFYKGGFTYLTLLLTKVLIKTGIRVDDFNSLYPKVMRDFEHPIGGPLYICREKNCNHFVLLEINLSAKLKKGNIPCIPDKNGYEQHIKYLEECDNQVIFITKDYWQLIQETYDISQFKVIKETHFRTRANLFTEYIDKWQEMKQTSKKGSFEYLFSKLMQNQLYGKFGMTPLRKKYYFTKYIPQKHKRKDIVIYGGDKQKMVMEYDWDLTMPSYIPMAISITDKAKIMTIRTANLANKCTHLIPTGGFIYSDTDSIHYSICDDCLKIYEDNVDLHPTKLGALDREKHTKYGYYLKRKFYLLFDRLMDPVDPKKCGMAGVNKNEMTSYTYGQVLRRKYKATKLQKQKVAGGVILIRKEIDIDDN